jgi:imidazole glycerol-phosphate synthase subunit HisF
MKRIRVIPVLLIHNRGLVKSLKFKDYKYVGDPINAVRIFNEKEVDELAILDIDASRENRVPDISRIEEIVSEAFMPIAYGGGITAVDQVKRILSVGVEKVILNRSAVKNPALITEIARQFGSQSVVVSIDYKKNFFGKPGVYTENGKTNTGLDPLVFAKQMEEAGAGEILLNSMERDGSFSGYDLDMIEKISGSINIPMIAVGGASSLSDFKQAVQHGASAVSAGSMFVFQRPHRAVLISYPSQQELENQVYEGL